MGAFPLTAHVCGGVFLIKHQKNHCVKLHDSAGSFEDNKTSALSLFSVISLGSVGAFYVFFSAVIWFLNLK